MIHDGPRRRRPAPRAGTRARRLRTALVLAAPMAFLAAAFVWPLSHVLEAAFVGLGRGATPAREAWSWASGGYVRGRVEIALVQALWSVAVTMALAIPLAWLHHRFGVRHRRLHLALHAAPFVLPVFVVVYGVQAVLGSGGWVHEWTGVNVLGRLGPLGAVVIAHAYYNYGLAARLLSTTLDARPRRLESAAATLGAPPGSAFLRVTLPQLAPGIASIALLVFVFAFTSFGVVLLMGAGEISTLETMIYRNLVTAFPSESRAAVIGIVQLAINAVLLGAYLTLVRRQPTTQRERRPARKRPSARTEAAAWVALALGLTPALAVLVGGFRVRGEWTLEAWRAILDHQHSAHVAGFDLLHAVWLSLTYGVLTVMLSVGLTLLYAYGARGLHLNARRGTELLGAIPLGTSSVLVGLGFLLAFGADDHLDLRGTRTLIVAAHTLVAFPFVARVLLPALDRLDSRQDEAAALLGARPWDVFRRIHLPQLRPPLVAAAGFAAALSFGDFGASLILMRPDNMSLAVWIGRHDRPFDPLMNAQAIALSGVLMLLTTVAYVVVERFRNPERGGL